MDNKGWLQVYVDRHDGNGLSLDGCWGSEHGRFAVDDRKSAVDAMKELALEYPDVDWVLASEPGQCERERIVACEA